MNSLLEIFETWLAERIFYAQTALTDRISVLEAEIQTLRIAAPETAATLDRDGRTLSERVTWLENHITDCDTLAESIQNVLSDTDWDNMIGDEVNGMIDSAVDEKVDAYLDDNLDEKVVDAVRGLTFSVEVSRY